MWLLYEVLKGSRDISEDELMKLLQRLQFNEIAEAIIEYLRRRGK